jgi:hypothetical protein
MRDPGKFGWIRIYRSKFRANRENEEKMAETRCLVRVGGVRDEYCPAAVFRLSTKFESFARLSEVKKIDREAGRSMNRPLSHTPKGKGGG